MLTVIKGNVPSKSNCYGIRKGGNGLYKKKTLKDYETAFAWQCKKMKKVKGSFGVYLNVFYPSRRADLDNCLKIILDCLQVNDKIDNDRYCLKIEAYRFVDKHNPRIELEVTKFPKG